MKEIQTVAVGLELDESGQKLTQGSKRAVEEAVWLARGANAKLVFIHSVWRDRSFDPLTATVAVVGRGLSEPGRAALEACVVEAEHSGLKARLELAEERPLVSLSRAARAGADVVLVGKRDAVENDGRRLGSVSSKLLRKCPSPVWVVHPREETGLRPVLVATDLGEVGGEAVRWGARLAALRGTSLELVHAYQVPMSVQLEASRVSDQKHEEQLAEIERAARNQMRTVLDETGFEGEVHLRVGCSTPERAIHECVDRLHPRVLVMGTISRGGLAGILLGTTAERLLGQVDCSILVVKPPDFVSPLKLD